MIIFLSEFEDKVQEMTSQVDQAAENEDYDEAERIQDELEKFQTANAKKIERYRAKLESGEEQEPADDYAPPTLESPLTPDQPKEESITEEPILEEATQETSLPKKVGFEESESEEDLCELKNTHEKIYRYNTGEDVEEHEIKKSYTMTANEI